MSFTSLTVQRVRTLATTIASRWESTSARPTLADWRLAGTPARGCLRRLWRQAWSRNCWMRSLILWAVAARKATCSARQGWRRLSPLSARPRRERNRGLRHHRDHPHGPALGTLRRVPYRGLRHAGWLQSPASVQWAAGMATALAHRTNARGRGAGVVCRSEYRVPTKGGLTRCPI